ncbi:eukaryotic translation initiation factor 2D [Sitodiplosis mosellana]|uniref:eukaryotic translation initiation factor 2D n=1 Tax=Sitodiplosis mosellana TaxID=263140 RepID=UPI0024451E6E|nr:eukaryotic translation initiation factor 2D [Sitodiplosis mosellana]
MFVKPFKLKNNTQIKSTERKKLRTKIETAFALNEDDLNKLLPSKSTLNQVKLIVNAGQMVTVYTCDRRPMFFEFSPSGDDTKQVLVPTVYSMWILPELVPSFTTHAAVLPRLAGGADLMLPGIIKQGTGYSTYGNYARDAVVAVNLTSNRSAVAVGLLARSSADLYMAANQGVGVKILHVFGDKLWGLEPAVCLQVPNAGAIVKPPTMDDFPALGETRKPVAVEKKVIAPAAAPESVSETQLETDMQNVDISKDDGESAEEHDESAEVAESPDDKLKRAFLLSIKKMGKKPPTPLLTSNFYRNHILEADSGIDIKKTSYKKLSKFLQEMASYNYLTVKEEPKGVEKIVAINITHPDVVNTILNVSDSGPQSESKATGLFVTEMKELYTVTSDTMKFFNIFDVKCGEGIEPAQVKKYVKEYVCNKKLQDPANIRQIRVDEMLREVCQLDESNKLVPFDVILATITDRMDHSYAMRNRNELKTSGKQNTIKMTLATRCGNKQVTLIDGMELFGIRLQEFAQACKVGVAASTSIIRPDCPANANKGQLMVQGNQVRFVHKLLTETYKIPPKFITGLDLAKKEKKKKK